MLRVAGSIELLGKGLRASLQRYFECQLEQLLFWPVRNISTPDSSRPTPWEAFTTKAVLPNVLSLLLNKKFAEELP